MEKEPLTNEFIRDKFKNQFELVSYAIKLAEQKIRRGSESENVAVDIIDDIIEGRDKFDEAIFVSKEVIKEPQDLKNGAEIPAATTKSADKKKARRILA